MIIKIYATEAELHEDYPGYSWEDYSQYTENEKNLFILHMRICALENLPGNKTRKDIKNFTMIKNGVIVSE